METGSASPRPDGVTILALWYAVLAGGALMGACAAAIPMGFLRMAPDLDPEGRVAISILLGLGLTATLTFAAVAAAVSWGLWQLRDWARIAAMVLAILHLPFFPVGTAIGVATLWYLTSQPDAVAAFRRS